MKRNFVLPFLLITTCLSALKGADIGARKYIGTTFSPDSERLGDLAKDGIKMWGGKLPWPDADDNLIVQLFSAKDHPMAWFVKRVSPLEPVSNNEFWIHVLDVLESPSLKPDESFFGSDCTVSGKDDYTIVAVASTKTDKSGNCLYVRQAWRVNKKNLKFEAVPTKNIVCTPEIDD